jgi:hypothetical protein
VIYILGILLKSHLLLIIIVLISQVIEKNTKWKLLIYEFKYPKNIKSARGSADFHSIIYFVFCLCVLLFSLYNNENIPDSYAFWKWLLIVIPLTILFNKIYYKFTAKDPKRADDDFG